VIELGDVPLLACPACRSSLTFEGQAPAGRLERGELRCAGCGARWPVLDGLSRLYREDEVRGTDRLLRYIYDGLPSLHDPLTAVVFPLLESKSEREARDFYLERVDLPSLRPREDGRPIRVLEVGVGSGGDLMQLRRWMPSGLPIELWGVDLSAGMLGVLRRRLRRSGDRTTRVLMADAHALPFPAGSFDRVFQIGAVNNYRDPRTALAEMARVSVPGAPIVVVDEALDARRPQSLVHRAFFRAITFYDPDPHCPVELLPEGAADVRAEQMSRFFYCLTFRVPA
jgi:SAM-dependent methyltransferase